MHPPYTEEKAFAQRLAELGESQATIANDLRFKYDLSFYTAGTIARHAVEFAQEKKEQGKSK